jgi:diguanylate cyclase (GGDEF)-like protein
MVAKFAIAAARVESIAKPEEVPVRPLSLDTVLEQCTTVKAMIEASVHDLAWINQALEQDLADPGCEPAATDAALKRTGIIETRLNEAAQALSVVSRALAGEIRERRMLDHQFAAIQEQEAAARQKLLHDTLTGMPNRILFNDRLEHGLAQSLRHGRPLAVMFIDLDGFKNVNDTYGHDVGDAVLQAMATRLQEHTRGEDTASRHGGDEFLYLISEPGKQESIASLARRVIRLIQEPCIVSSQGIEVSIELDASIGISISPKDGTTVDKLIKRADAAMYRAKQQKSGYSFAI